MKKEGSSEDALSTEVSIVNRLKGIFYGLLMVVVVKWVLGSIAAGSLRT